MPRLLLGFQETAGEKQVQDQHAAVNLSTCGGGGKTSFTSEKDCETLSVAVLLLFAWRRPRCVQLKYLSAEQFERRGAVFVKL